MTLSNHVAVVFLGVFVRLTVAVLVALCLQRKETGVAAAGLHESIVRTLFDDFSVVQDNDAVRSSNGGQAVRNQDTGPAPPVVANVFIKKILGLSVQTRAGLI